MTSPSLGFMLLLDCWQEKRGGGGGSEGGSEEGKKEKEGEGEERERKERRERGVEDERREGKEGRRGEERRKGVMCYAQNRIPQKFYTNWTMGGKITNTVVEGRSNARKRAVLS